MKSRDLSCVFVGMVQSKNSNGRIKSSSNIKCFVGFEATFTNQGLASCVYWVVWARLETTWAQHKDAKRQVGLELGLTHKKPSLVLFSVFCVKIYYESNQHYKAFFYVPQFQGSVESWCSQLAPILGFNGKLVLVKLPMIFLRPPNQFIDVLFRKYFYHGESWFQKCLPTSSLRIAHFVELGPFCNMNFDALLESQEKKLLVLASILPLSKLVKSAKCPHSSCTPQKTMQAHLEKSTSYQNHVVNKQPHISKQNDRKQHCVDIGW